MCSNCQGDYENPDHGHDVEYEEWLDTLVVMEHDWYVAEDEGVREREVENE